jgi:2,3-bisphosphoglycerate-independent phosphoglycerate mutase
MIQFQKKKKFTEIECRKGVLGRVNGKEFLAKIGFNK